MMFYVFIAIVALPGFFIKIKSLIGAVKENNKGKIKAELFFLFLMILIVTIMIIVHEW